jgi:hypothetical protein
MILVLILVSAFVPIRKSCVSLQHQQQNDAHTYIHGKSWLKSFVDDDELFRSILDDTSPPDSSIMVEELHWRSLKVKLEEDHQRKFMQSLKSKPRKLPYEDAVSSESYLVFYILITSI